MTRWVLSGALVMAGLCLLLAADHALAECCVCKDCVVSTADFCAPSDLGEDVCSIYCNVEGCPSHYQPDPYVCDASAVDCVLQTNTPRPHTDQRPQAHADADGE